MCDYLKIENVTEDNIKELVEKQNETIARIKFVSELAESLNKQGVYVSINEMAAKKQVYKNTLREIGRLTGFCDLFAPFRSATRLVVANVMLNLSDEITCIRTEDEILGELENIADHETEMLVLLSRVLQWSFFRGKGTRGLKSREYYASSEYNQASDAYNLYRAISAMDHEQSSLEYKDFSGIKNAGGIENKYFKACACANGKIEMKLSKRAIELLDGLFEKYPWQAAA